MANEYQVAYPLTGATVNAQVYRDGTAQEAAPINCPEVAGEDGIYIGSKVAAFTLTAGDDIVYYDGTTIIASETYKPSVTPSGGASNSVIAGGYAGDFLEDETVYLYWNEAATITGGTVTVYRAGGGAITTAPTDERDYGGRDVNLITIDLSADAGYLVGNDYQVVLLDATVDGTAGVDIVLGSFSIENRYQGKEFRRDT